MPIRVVTLNVWALPVGISRDNNARMRAIGHALAALNADVFAFQEVWTAAARDTLVAAGRDLGFPGVWHNPGNFSGSGLLVLSRFPIEATRFTPFRARGLPQRVQHSDYYGGKGFAILDVSTPDGPLSLLDTHLHARYVHEAADDEYQGIRTAQVIQLCQALRPTTRPLIALGDFNLREEDVEYGALVGLSGLRDCAVEVGARQATVVTGTAYKAAGADPEERIDYVFCRDGQQKGLQARSVRRVFDAELDLAGQRAAYSDHVGLLADIDFVAARPASGVSAQAVERARNALTLGIAQAHGRRSRQRVEAALAWTGAGLAASARQLPTTSRRSVIRRVLLAAGLLFAGGGAGLLSLSEGFVPAELEALDFAAAQLDEIARDSS